MSERRTRRGFMGLTSIAIAGALGGPSPRRTTLAAAAADTGDADLVVFNAKV